MKYNVYIFALIVVFFSASNFSKTKSEFIVVQPVSEKTVSSRAELREEILCLSGDLVENVCDCICQKTKKLNDVKQLESIKQTIEAIVSIQQKLFAMIRQLLDHDKKWVKVTREKLNHIKIMLQELSDDLFQEHDHVWWRHKKKSLDEILPKTPQ